MRYGFVFLLTLVLSFSLGAGNTWAAIATPAEGEAFPVMTLAAPEKAAEREYLGLTGKGPFKISQVKSDLVIVEIFSMYCPYCQKEAPNMNELYRLIDKNADIRDRVKIIGIGAGNTAFEVDVFRKEYGIEFPLIPDEQFSVHKAVGEVRTPYFFVIRVNRDGSNKIVYSKVGSIQDPARFLEMVIEKAGLKREESR